MYIRESLVNIRETTFNSNIAGAVSYLLNRSPVICLSFALQCILLTYALSVVQGGGALIFDRGNGIIESSSFNGNNATDGNGGALLLFRGSAQLTDGFFAGNSAIEVSRLGVFIVGRGQLLISKSKLFSFFSIGR